MSRLMTRSVIRDELRERFGLNVPDHQLAYLLRARNIEPQARAGNSHVYAPEVVDRLASEIRRLDRDRGIVHA